MPIISGTINQHGALIVLRVGVSRKREKLLKKQRVPIPEPISVVAQIDTGSFATAFPSHVFTSLELQPFAKIAVRTPSTRREAPHHCLQYDVSVELSSGTSRVTLPSVKAIAVDDFEREEEVQAILGRDILQCCSFQYFGPDGIFNLAF